MALERQQSLSKVAFELNFDFLDKQDQSPLAYLKDFRLFREGGSKKAYHLMSKKDDLLESELRIFDYKYTISTGKSSHTYHQTVFFLQSKKLGLPQFFMSPETLFHRFKEYLGFRKDIDFAEFPKFSEQYYLHGEDPEYIRSAFDSRVLRLFTVEPDWHVEGVNYYLVFYRKHKLLPPREIKRFYELGLKLARFMEAESLDLE